MANSEVSGEEEKEGNWGESRRRLKGELGLGTNLRLDLVNVILIEQISIVS